MRHPAFKFLQPGVAVRLEAGFPVIESGSPNMRFMTCPSNITGFLPDLEEELALLESGEAKVRMSLAHAVMLLDFRVLFKVQLTKTKSGIKAIKIQKNGNPKRKSDVITASWTYFGDSHIQFRTFVLDIAL
jgi:hypothetical protein